MSIIYIITYVSHERGYTMEWVYLAIHYGDNERGHIAYNKETKECQVVLDDATWKEKVESYLQTEQTVMHATGLNTYDELTVQPLDSYEYLKLAFTRMWNKNGVQVDWGIPVEVDGQLYFAE